jgi:hypothetical protein
VALFRHRRFVTAAQIELQAFHSPDDIVCLLLVASI